MWGLPHSTRLRPMDAPPIQYACTEDGVNIAYWTLGDRANQFVHSGNIFVLQSSSKVGDPLILQTRNSPFSYIVN